MPDPITRYTPIDPSLFISNRANLAKALSPNGLAIVPSKDMIDSYWHRHAALMRNHDLFYLTGIEQKETILLLYPDAPDQSQRELLFIKRPETKDILWKGDLYSQAGAATVTGIEGIHWLETFPQFLHALMKQADHVYLHSSAALFPMAKVTENSSSYAPFTKWLQEHYPSHQYKELAPIMRRLRTIKSPTEIALIKKACQITREGWEEMIPHVRPRVMEYELEALLISSFLKRASRGFAYPPIIASGSNANILHYTANSNPCQEGALLLVDVGAEYAGYNADMTRTIPVSGRFSQRQKEVYNSVLTIMQTAKELLRPGLLLKEYEQEVGRAMTVALRELGLLTAAEASNSQAKQAAYKRYFMHATSHHLGLEVHDTADNTQPITSGMVLTVEPGIYIPEEKMGIRLENDIHLLADGIEDLMEEVPLSPDAIEASMQSAMRKK